MQQPDTVVVKSDRRYGERVELPAPISREHRDFRIHFLWRAILYDRFATDRWALHADLDEFVHLPPGMTFPDLVPRLDRHGARALWAVMLDVYPKDVATHLENEGSARLDMSATWYFDAVRHLRLRRRRPPKVVYPGARARLYCEYGMDALYPALGIRPHDRIPRLLRRVGLRLKPLLYNSIVKPVLLRWGPGCYLQSPHHANLTASADHLLPIQHFRFSGALGRRARMALRRGLPLSRFV